MEFLEMNPMTGVPFQIVIPAVALAVVIAMVILSYVSKKKGKK